MHTHTHTRTHTHTHTLSLSLSLSLSLACTLLHVYFYSDTFPPKHIRNLLQNIQKSEEHWLQESRFDESVVWRLQVRLLKRFQKCFLMLEWKTLKYRMKSFLSIPKKYKMEERVKTEHNLATQAVYYFVMYMFLLLFHFAFCIYLYFYFKCV